MPIIDPTLQQYLEGLAYASEPVLDEMHALAKERDFPIVGPQVGRLLYVLAKTSGARRVFELGSGFGYSAWWFCKAMGPEGRVVLTDASRENCDLASNFLGRAGFGERVQIEQDSAFDAFDRLADGFGPIDIVFCDIDKHGYPEAYDRAARVLRPGGLFITDNMLWSGQVIDDSDQSADTEGVRALTERLYSGSEFLTALMPVRDGVTVAVRC